MKHDLTTRFVDLSHLLGQGMMGQISQHRRLSSHFSFLHGSGQNNRQMKRRLAALHNALQASQAKEEPNE